MPKKLSTEEKLTNLILDADSIKPDKSNGGYIVITYHRENNNEVPNILYAVDGDYDNLLIAMVTVAIDKTSMGSMIKDANLSLLVDEESESDKHRYVIISALNDISDQVESNEQTVCLSNEHARSILDFVLKGFYKFKDED